MCFCKMVHFRKAASARTESNLNLEYACSQPWLITPFAGFSQNIDMLMLLPSEGSAGWRHVPSNSSNNDPFPEKNYKRETRSKNGNIYIRNTTAK